MPRVTLKLLLNCLVFLALLPPLAFMGFQAIRLTQQRLDEIQSVGDSLTQQIGIVSELLLAERGALLRALAASPALKTGDLAAFYQHARAALDPDEGAVVVAGIETGWSKILLSTAAPFGVPLPAPRQNIGILETRRRAAASGQIELSDVAISPVTGQPGIVLFLRAPGTEYVVSVAIRAGWVNEQLAEIKTTGWALAIADRNGQLLGRSKDLPHWDGGQASLPTWASVAIRDNGWVRSETPEGAAVYFSWRRLPSGWMALAAVSENDLDFIPRVQATTVSVAALAVSLSGLLLATFAAIAIGRPLTRISAAAIAFGRGEAITPAGSRIREINDVTEAFAAGAAARAAAEAALREREEDTRNLAYAASHDLKAPTSTLQLLFQQLDAHLDAGDEKMGRQLVRIGLGTVARMRELIEKLAEYSRAMTKAPLREEINLKQLVETVLIDLTQQRNETGAQVAVGELPSVRGDPVHFRAIFQNLLSNAMRYRKQDATPFITVSVEDSPSSDIISLHVKDDGIGIAPEYHARVFEMFQRLHVQGDIPGSGLGLFVCKRIVRSYGGDIRIRSELGRGAEFIVELPRAMRVT